MNIRLAVRAALLALAIPAAAHAAAPTLIDFDTPPADLQGGGDYAGYRWDSFDTVSVADLVGAGIPGIDFGVANNLLAGNAVYASTAGAGFTTLGANFDLLGASLLSMNSPDFTPNGAFSVQVLGLRFDTATSSWQQVASATYDFDAASPGAVRFAGFTNLSAVRFGFVSDEAAPNFVVLDNVTVQAVPEPGEYAMLLAGLGMLGLATRRRLAR